VVKKEKREEEKEGKKEDFVGPIPATLSPLARPEAR
jgi:hypothetical protein